MKNMLKMVTAIIVLMIILVPSTYAATASSSSSTSASNGNSESSSSSTASGGGNTDSSEISSSGDSTSSSTSAIASDEGIAITSSEANSSNGDITTTDIDASASDEDTAIADINIYDTMVIDPKLMAHGYITADCNAVAKSTDYLYIRDECGGIKMQDNIGISIVDNNTEDEISASSKTVPEYADTIREEKKSDDIRGIIDNILRILHLA